MKEVSLKTYLTKLRYKVSKLRRNAHIEQRSEIDSILGFIEGGLDVCKWLDKQ